MRQEHHRPEKLNLDFCAGEEQTDLRVLKEVVLVLMLSPACRELTQMAFVYFVFRMKLIELITKTLASSQTVSQLCHLAAGALITRTDGYNERLQISAKR